MGTVRMKGLLKDCCQRESPAGLGGTGEAERVLGG